MSHVFMDVFKKLVQKKKKKQKRDKKGLKEVVVFVPDKKILTLIKVDKE